jgi:hypothetical protein
LKNHDDIDKNASILQQKQLIEKKQNQYFDISPQVLKKNKVYMVSAKFPV